MRSSPNLSVGYASRCFLAAAAHLHKDSLVASSGRQAAWGAGPERLLLTTAMCDGVARREQTPERCGAVVSP